MEGQGAATDASLAAVDRVASEMKISHGSCQHVSLQLYTSNADCIWQLLKIKFASKFTHVKVVQGICSGFVVLDHLHAMTVLV